MKHWTSKNCLYNTSDSKNEPFLPLPVTAQCLCNISPPNSKSILLSHVSSSECTFGSGHLWVDRQQSISTAPIHPRSAFCVSVWNFWSIRTDVKPGGTPLKLRSSRWTNRTFFHVSRSASFALAQNTHRGFGIQNMKRASGRRGWRWIRGRCAVLHTSEMRQWRTQDFTGTHSNASSSTSASPPKPPRWATSTPPSLPLTRGNRQWPPHALSLMWGDSISCLMRCTDCLSRKQIHTDLGKKKNRKKRIVERFNLPAAPDGWAAERFPIVCGQIVIFQIASPFFLADANTTRHRQQLWKRPHWFKGFHVRPYNKNSLSLLLVCLCCVSAIVGFDSWLWFLLVPLENLLFLLFQRSNCIAWKQIFLYVLGKCDFFLHRLNVTVSIKRRRRSIFTIKDSFLTSYFQNILRS